MNFISTFIQYLQHTLTALTPWWPVLAGATLIEVIKPGKKAHWPTIISNCIYMPFALVLGALAIGQLAPWVHAHIPSDITHLKQWADTPSKKIILWLFYLFAFDFLYYWLHRMQHQIPWLWRYHMVHHSDINTSASTVGRHHWLEEFFRLFIINTPLIILMGGSQDTPMWVTASIILNGIFMHWNISIRFGPLEKIIITPAYHRIHHSIEERHYDKNFGVFTQLWDYVFSTRHLPRPNEYPETGITGLSSIRSWVLILPWPVDLTKKQVSNTNKTSSD